MKREFLEGLNLEKEVIDQIMGDCEKKSVNYLLW